jgi:hypothetical protein
MKGPDAVARLRDRNLAGQFLCARARFWKLPRRGRSRMSRTQSGNGMSSVAGDWAFGANHAALEGGVMLLMQQGPPILH